MNPPEPRGSTVRCSQRDLAQRVTPVDEQPACGHQRGAQVCHGESAGCGVAAAPPTTVAAGPFGTLASTGGEMPFLPIGAAMIGVAFVSYGVIRRSRQTASQ